MQLKKINNKIFFQNLSKRVVLQLVSRIKLFVFVLFLLLAGYCFYVWYSFVYNPKWSDDKKAQYIKDHNNEVTFDTKKFKLYKNNLKRVWFI